MCILQNCLEFVIFDPLLDLSLTFYLYQCILHPLSSLVKVLIWTRPLTLISQITNISAIFYPVILSPSARVLFRVICEYDQMFTSYATIPFPVSTANAILFLNSLWFSPLVLMHRGNDASHVCPWAQGFIYATYWLLVDLCIDLKDKRRLWSDYRSTFADDAMTFSLSNFLSTQMRVFLSFLKSKIEMWISEKIITFNLR